MTDATQTVGVAVLALGILRVLEKVVTGLVEKKKEGNGKAGEKSPEYWELRFREIVERAIETHVVPELKEIRSALTTLIRWKGTSGD